jgi:hypothetical protein
MEAQILYHSDYYIGKNNWEDNDELFGKDFLKNKTEEHNECLKQNDQKYAEFFEELFAHFVTYEDKQ